jgi:hypothetical protein
VRIKYPVFGSVSDFLDELYSDVSSAVEAGTFGRIWALRDSTTGKLYKEMGRSWARDTLNSGLDTRPLQEVGIVPGMIFEAVYIDNAQAPTT